MWTEYYLNSSLGGVLGFTLTMLMGLWFILYVYLHIRAWRQAKAESVHFDEWWNSDYNHKNYTLREFTELKNRGR